MTDAPLPTPTVHTDRQELLLSCDRWPEAKFLEEWADQMPQGVTPDAGSPDPDPDPDPDH